MRKIAATLALGLIVALTGFAFAAPRLFVFNRPGITYYFSATGSDSNDCKSEGTPCQTLAKMASLMYFKNDVIKFNGGDTFTGCVVLTGDNIRNTTAVQPVIIEKYGTGYPTFVANCTAYPRVGILELRSVNHVIVQDIIWRGNNGGASVGIYLTNPSSVASFGIIIRRNDISGFWQPSIADAGAHIFIQAGFSGSGEFRNVQIRDNILHGATVTAFDESGVNGNAQFGYPLINCQITGNHTYWFAGQAGRTIANANGLLINNANGCVAEYNLAHDIGANHISCGGPVGVWTHDSINITLQFNEVFNIRPLPVGVHPSGGCDFNGMGLDGGAGATINSVMQYNYTHDNYGSGYYVWGNEPASAGNVVRYNISENDNLGGVNAFGCMSAVGGNQGRVDFYNNTCYTPGATVAGNAAVFGFNSGVPSSGVIANNIFITTPDSVGRCLFFNAGLQDPVNIIIANNDYHCIGGANWHAASWTSANTFYTDYASWQAATGLGSGDLFVDPLIVGTAGVAGQCVGPGARPCPEIYFLQGGSPLLGSGRNLNEVGVTGIGSRDFYGADVPPMNIGAGGVATALPYIAISALTFAENSAQGTVIGTLAIENDPGGIWVYTVENSAMGRVQVAGAVLQVGATSTDLEVSPKVLVRISGTNGTITLTQSFILTPSNVNEEPTDVLISNSVVSDAATVSAVVGVLSAADELGDSATFTCQGGCSGGKYSVSGTNLLVNAALTAGTDSVTVRATDGGSLFLDKVLSIRVLPNADAGVLNQYGENLVGWWDASDANTITVSGGGALTQWRSLTGVAASGSTGYSATGFDGTRATITCNGIAAGNILQAPGPFAETLSVFIVAERGTQTTSSASGFRPLVATAAAPGGSMHHAYVGRSGMDSTNFFVNGSGTGSVASSVPWAIGSKAILYAKLHATDARARANGGAPGGPGADGTGPNHVDKFYICGDTAVTARRFNGKIAEIVAVSGTEPDDAARQLTEGILACKWNLQSELGAGHPHKTVCP